MKPVHITPATFMSAADTHHALDRLERTDVPYDTFVARLNRLDDYVRENFVFSPYEKRTLRKRLGALYEETWSRHPLREPAFRSFVVTARTAKWYAGSAARWPKSLRMCLASQMEGCPDDEIPEWLTACLVFFSCRTPADIAEATGNQVTTHFFNSSHAG